MVTRSTWRELRLSPRSSEEQAELDAIIARGFADYNRLRGQETGETCDVCHDPLRYGDDAATDLTGRLTHQRCA